MGLSRQCVDLVHGVLERPSNLEYTSLEQGEHEHHYKHDETAR